MKKLIYILSFLTLTVASAIGQSKEEREMTNFSKINLTGIAEVIITQEENFSVIVETNENKFEDVITTLTGKTLSISTKDNWKNDNPIIYISLPNLEQLKSSGASEVKSTGVINSKSLKLITSGATEVNLSIKTERLTINSSGASELTLKGYSSFADINSSGAADIESDELNIDTAIVSLSGASSTDINVSESITGTTSGASSLDIKGNPTTQSINKSGVSSVNRNENTIRIDEDKESFTLSIDNKEGIKIEERNMGDTTKITIGRKKLLIIDDYDNTKVDLELKDSTSEDDNWYYGISGISIGVNGFLNNKNQLKVPSTHDYLELDIAKSINFQITALDANIDIYKKYVTFHPGLGLEFNSYEFRKNYWIEPSSEFNSEITANQAIKSDSSILKFDKNRLKDTYLNIPLMLAFHTNKDHKKAFHLGIGGYAGVKLASKMKYKYKLNGDGNKDKVKDDYYLSPFRYGLMASVGYSNINVFANYALNGLFEEGKGPELHPFSVGLMIVGF